MNGDHAADPRPASCCRGATTQGIGPRDFTIDPSGTLLLVANQDTDTVVTFWIDPDSGKLAATGHVAKVPTPVCIQLVGNIIRKEN
jgi:6-phosphogluconolactonase